MIALLLLACVDSPDATLDDDNWLSGSFVDEYHPLISSVHIAAGERGGDYTLEVVYLDEADEALVMVHAGWTEAEDGSITIDDVNPIPTVSMPFAPTLDVGNQPVTLELIRDGSEIRGTFEVSACEGLCGGFAAPIDWDGWY